MSSSPFFSAMHSSALAVVLALVAAPSSSHGVQATDQLVPLSGSEHTPQRIRYDLGSRSWFPSGPDSGGVELGSTLSYDNTCWSGLTATLPPGLEFVDWGVKAAGSSGLVESITVGYETSEPFGAGASLTVSFYAGATGYGALGAEMARIDLTGLPGSIDGSPSIYLVTLELADASFTLPDGPIGYGFSTPDATTGVLIGDAVSCPVGQDDAYDVHSAPAGSGTYQGTFSFGGAPSATFVIGLSEATGDPCSSLAPIQDPCLLDCIATYVAALEACDATCDYMDCDGSPGDDSCRLACYWAAADARALCMAACGGWVPRLEQSDVAYGISADLTLGAARYQGDVVLDGPGSVTDVDFYLLDLAFVPPGGFPASTCVEDYPWIAIAPGVFDGDRSWLTSVRIGGAGGVPYSSRGYVVRIDMNDPTETYIRMGAGFLRPANGYRSGGSNPLSLCPVADPVIGGTWSTSLDVASTGHALGLLFAYAGQAELTLPGGQVLLANVLDPAGELLALTPQAGAMVHWDLSVPNDPTLLGFAFTAQAAHVGGVTPFLLTNALDRIIGS